MKSLGNWLRATREAKGFTFQDVEERIRIRVRYLEALETGDYGAIPGGESQVRGFLRRYASFLGLSSEEAITRYEQEVYGRYEEVVPAAPPAAPPSGTAPSPEMDIAPSPWRWVQVVGVAVVVVLLTLGGVWLLLQSGMFAGEEQTPAPVTAIPLSPLPAATVAMTTPPPTETRAPHATPTFSVTAGSGVTLTLEPLEHVWARVAVDGFVAFEGMLSPENPQTWVGEELVVVETGNGAGLIAVVNGQPQGPLCGRGEVCARGWGPEGEAQVLPLSTGEH